MKAYKQLTVELGERSYPIWIGAGLLEAIPSLLQELQIQKQQKLFIITDDQVASRYLHPLNEALVTERYEVYSYTIPAGERSKSFEEYYRIMTYAMEHHLDRHSVVLALGGGVVGDLAGFVASTFMRGIPFVQIPTTVLAHDSSVGGKVAINHPLGKNMIGSFHQPLAVIYDTETLHTLPKREITSGFAEVVKHAFIWDSDFIHWLEENREPCLSLQEPYLSEALYRACQVKTAVVSQDETEQGIRAILNFGHTFGHAFEALGGYHELTHGEAIAIGMKLAARLSDMYYGDDGREGRVAFLLESFGLPVHREIPWNPDQVLDKMYADKKVLAGKMNLILLPKLGKAELVKDVSPDLIKRVVW